MRSSFVSIVSCATLLAWSAVASDQDVQAVEALNKRILQLHQQGQNAEALALAIKALRLSEDTLGPEHPATADCLNDLGGMYQSLGDYTYAETMFERGLAIREKVLGPEHQYTARNLMNLGSVYRQMGKFTKAEPLLLRALAINQKVLGVGAKDTATSLSHLGILYHDMGDSAKAESYAEQALAISQKVWTAACRCYGRSIHRQFAGANPVIESFIQFSEHSWLLARNLPTREFSSRRAWHRRDGPPCCCDPTPPS
jgi:tetratricopeptide (TPR) repeat protein